MSTQLDSLAPEKFPARGYEQFDMRGADEIRVVDVVSQTLANAISGGVEGKARSAISLLSNCEKGNNEDDENLREFS